MILLKSPHSAERISLNLRQLIQIRDLQLLHQQTAVLYHKILLKGPHSAEHMSLNPCQLIQIRDLQLLHHLTAVL